LSVFLLTLPIVFRRTFPVFTKKNKDTKEKYKAP
jgi:hypothetical protein